MLERSPSDLTSYIRYPENSDNHQRWRPNFMDPHIYWSFSFRQFVETYGDVAVLTGMISERQLVQMDAQVVQHFSMLAEQEWIRRAGMPLRFLPLDSSPEAIKSKNVYFLVSDPQLTGNAYTFTFPSDFLSRMKLSTFPVLSMDTLTELDDYMFLHEGAHSWEFKHAERYAEGDVPPFASDDHLILDCTRTVTAYKHHCPPVMNVIGSETSGFPTTLGPVDLAAAAQFVESWNERNQRECAELTAFLALDDADIEQGLKDDSSVSNIQMETLSDQSSVILQAFQETTDEILSANKEALHSTARIQQSLATIEKKSFSSWIDRRLHWAARQLSECHCYFPPENSLAHQRFWQDPSSWGKPSSPSLFAPGLNQSLALTSAAVTPAFQPVSLLRLGSG